MTSPRESSTCCGVMPHERVCIHEAVKLVVDTRDIRDPWRFSRAGLWPFLLNTLARGRGVFTDGLV